jgi:hypothetical protein
MNTIIGEEKDLPAMSKLILSPVNQPKRGKAACIVDAK